VVREAAGLAEWWAAGHREPGGPVTSGPGRDELIAKESEVLGYLAQDVDPEDDDLDDGDDIDVDALDDAEVFVEIKVARLLTALGLPQPDALPS
jgi:hypothetical protein